MRTVLQDEGRELVTSAGWKVNHGLSRFHRKETWSGPMGRLIVFDDPFAYLFEDQGEAREFLSITTLRVDKYAWRWRGKRVGDQSFALHIDALSRLCGARMLSQTDDERPWLDEIDQWLAVNPDQVDNPAFVYHLLGSMAVLMGKRFGGATRSGEAMNEPIVVVGGVEMDLLDELDRASAERLGSIASTLFLRAAYFHRLSARR